MVSWSFSDSLPQLWTTLKIPPLPCSGSSAPYQPSNLCRKPCHPIEAPVPTFSHDRTRPSTLMSALLCPHNGFWLYYLQSSQGLLHYLEGSQGSEVARSCPTLCNPVDCSPPGSSVHETLQARILEWARTVLFRNVARECRNVERHAVNWYILVGDT